MQLNELKLDGYRNYDSLTFKVDPGINLLIGANAQGKTNLLEAIYVLSLTKSHRTGKDKELIKWDYPEAKLSARVARRSGELDLELKISPEGKKAKVNHLEQTKLSEFVGRLNVVLFSPQDVEIVKGAPSIRRRFMDMEIGQVSPGYLHNLQQYKKILQQRNHYLRSIGGNFSSELLTIWDEQLVVPGIKMIQKRKTFIKKLEVWAQKIHEEITNGTEYLNVVYCTSWQPTQFERQVDETSLFAQFMLKLNEIKDQDLRRGSTLIGPHRDDLAFFINGKDVQAYGSQGQQRTVALSVKLAELELMYEELGEYPVLLLDDVLSELDQSRQTHLIETFQSRVQTFITTTGLQDIDMNRLKVASIYHVDRGHLVGR